ncbi:MULTISPECIES: exonuclease SbcCD subunit D [unclassified Corynebacterium]|uniref:metallophosphoesterase family protein n=1 Tax=unclassified Corynebacterium TaxID=2624378 RepID=UPI002169BBC9|nr:MULTISPECIES: exonuclease SbcCD subunit D [unclassified Corynebacterium]MCS4491792.1 exonuclease SbcCD subunit D [Corynebacterium sp. ES2715-CONJ3]MCS4531897.1 exonuclease SbcCD subunit D [Corynebacterium sp. ES2730-CONJ]
MAVKFLHTSDFQIGMTRAFLEGDAGPRFEAARKDAIVRLGEIAADNGCAFMVVAGDVFEHNTINARVRERALQALANIPVPVYLLPGNHDPLSADSIFHRVQEYEGLNILDDDSLREVLPGVELVGAPLRSKRAGQDLVAKALKDLLPTSAIRIVVGHGQALARSNEVNPDLIDLAAVDKALEQGIIDYVALGDTHSTQSVGSSGKVWYSGAPEVTDFREEPSGMGEYNSGNALIVEIEKSGHTSTVKPVEVSVGTWRFIAPHFELYSRVDVEDFFAYLDAFPDKDRVVIKYALTGSLDISTMRFFENGLAQRTVLFAALFPRTRLMDLAIQPTADDVDDLSFDGFAREAFEELIESTDPHAQEALKLLLRLEAGLDRT